MALEHGDLFFVNRSAATYKIEALELGEYLTNNALPNGTYFVNNGMLSITNTGNPLLTTPIGIHSANSATNTILDFDDNFIVTRSGSDASVTLNYPTVMEGLLCTDQNGNTPGFDESNCGCISLDFGYIANKLPCPNYGIVDHNGCLEINKCENGVLGLYGINEACLDVNICNKGGIINDGGCIALDYSEIINNIVCDVKSSGLLHDGSCISVNFEKVMAEMGLGKIRADNSIIIRDKNNNITNDGDLTIGDVKLSVNPAMYEAPPISDIVAEGCLVINGNSNLTTGEVKINLDEPCIIQLIKDNSSGGGSVDWGSITGKPPCFTPCGDPNAGGLLPCAGGGLTDVNGCLDINPVSDSCLAAGNIYGTRMTLRREGSATNPAIAWGVGTEGSNNGFYFGIGGATVANRIRFTGDKDWIFNDDPSAGEASCGGYPSGGKAEILNMQAPKADVHVGKGTPSPDLQHAPGSGHNNTPPYRHIKSWAFAGTLDASGKEVTIYSGGWGNKSVKGSDGKNYATGGASGWSPVPEDKDGTAPPSLKYAMTVDTSNGIVPTSLDVEAITEALVGDGTVTPADSNEGLLKFGTVKQEYLDEYGVSIDRYLETPRLSADMAQLGALHESLVKWDYTSDSWMEDPDDEGEYILKDPSERSREPVAFNDRVLIGIALMKTRFQSKRIHDLETTVAAMEARLAALESP